MKTVAWIVGEPGIGKTTAIRELIDSTKGVLFYEKPKWTSADGIVLAGHYKGDKFDGADTIPYNGAFAALEFWRDHFVAGAATLTVFDGDRFANKNCLAAVRSMVMGHECVLKCVLLSGSCGPERRAQRGTTQNESWVKGSKTKAYNFYRNFSTLDSKIVQVDGLAPSAVGAILREFLGVPPRA
jgi:hypothetical protein